ncbi:GntR family transcriptional regulator [Pediococcus pentosaceus]|uniref:GntR family transcriptional regulator n=1 Tax=Pediococcus pentosaceus TaxID=1255 RepID=UPI0020746161|nr:GntR family transcriptional regulator [Pediococcus pentosaceus]
MCLISQYNQIANTLKERIKKGDYVAGQHLPSQKELADEFHTSRVTIQKALDELSNTNLILRRQGSGTTVAPNSRSTLDILSSQYEGTTKLFEGRGKVTTKVLKFEIRFPSVHEQKRLSISDSTPVYDILRLRNIDNEPYELDHSIMPLSVIQNLTEKIASGSIYTFIESTLGLKIGSSIRKITADVSRKNDQDYLKCTHNEPILQVSQTVHLSDGRPFEYSQTRHRYDKGGVIVINNTLSSNGLQI